MPLKIFNKKKTGTKILTWQKILITATIVFIIVIGAFMLGVVKKKCKDEACFNEALRRCSTATYLKLENFNYYAWSINGKTQDSCKINIKLVKMATGTPVDKVQLFEGKEMDCAVPKEIFSKAEGSKVENVLNYCTGPLKEAIYQSIIERLYTVIISNLGGAINEIQRTLKTGTL